MQIEKTLLTLLATAAIGVFTILGSGFDRTIDGASEATATPTLVTSQQAAGFSAVSRAFDLGAKARHAVKNGAADVATRLVRRYDLHGRLLTEGTPDAAELAKAYGISESAVNSLSSSATARAAAIERATDRGVVKFTARSGNTFDLVRPAESVAKDAEIRALLDVDNVIANYADGFRRGVAEMLEVDTRTLPENPYTYGWNPYWEPVRTALADGIQTDGLNDFRTFLVRNGQLDSFMASDANEFFDVFNPFHKYFVENGLYSDLTILPGASEGVKTLHSQWDIGVVTKRYGHAPSAKGKKGPNPFGWTAPGVPTDSARWIDTKLNGYFDSLTVMGENKANFAGHVHAVFEDSVSNIEKIRKQNATQALRERAFAEGVPVDELDNWLARNNTQILGGIFDWKYNETHPLSTAANVVRFKSWDDAVDVTMAYRRLLNEEGIAPEGTLHWREVDGLAKDGKAIPAYGPLRPEPAARKLNQEAWHAGAYTTGDSPAPTPPPATPPATTNSNWHAGAFVTGSEAAPRRTAPATTNWHLGI